MTNNEHCRSQHVFLYVELRARIVIGNSLNLYVLQFFLFYVCFACNKKPQHAAAECCGMCSHENKFSSCFVDASLDVVCRSVLSKSTHVAMYYLFKLLQPEMSERLAIK